MSQNTRDLENHPDSSLNKCSFVIIIIISNLLNLADLSFFFITVTKITYQEH